jgi:hypothetical protein
MAQVVWDGAARRKLAVREAGTCRQHFQPSTRPVEQVISASWPSLRTAVKAAPLLEAHEQKLGLQWGLLNRRAEKAK